MRSIPNDLNLEPMPEDFTCNITEPSYGLMKATVTINGLKYEVGIRSMGTADAVHYLKQSIWQLLQLAKVGRTDLCLYASVDRHKR